MGFGFASVAAKTCSQRSARNAGLFLCGVIMASLAGCSSAAEPAPKSDLDLSRYQPSFAEEFDTLDISEWGCLSRWIAHTPWGGDFGSARFAPPDDNFPFRVEDGILHIEARRDPSGKWQSGMISSWDACNSGFAQKYGYFEVKARLPDAPGFWPAFWMVGVDKSRGTAEIDVFEYHTATPDRFSLGNLKHPAKAGEARLSATTKHHISGGLLSAGFNTFGVEISPDATVFYLNRQEIWRTETTDEFRQPMYLLVSFPVDDSEVTSETPDSVTMAIDYVRAYQRKPIGF